MRLMVEKVAVRWVEGASSGDESCCCCFCNNCCSALMAYCFLIFFEQLVLVEVEG